MSVRHTAIVLAAGASRRLGRDKAALQRADGSRFLEHVIGAALATDPLAVLVVRRPDHGWPVNTPLPGCVQRVDCLDADDGMGASLRCGLRALPAASDGVLVLLLDQPALDAAHLLRLVTAWHAQPTFAVASRYAGVRGAPAVLPRSSLATLTQLRGDNGARQWLRGHADVIEIEASALLADVDHPGDWPG